MKSKLTMKLLGIVVTVATLASLLVGLTAAPVSAAAPGALAWTTTDAPSNVNYILGGKATGTPDCTLVAASSTGVVFAWDDTNKIMYKSADGINWSTKAIAIAGVTGTPVGLVVSPNFATDSAVVLATSNGVWVTTDAGATWGAVAGAPANITSVDLGYWITTSGVLTILVGSSTAGVQYMKWSVGSAWTAVGALTEVYAVKFSPTALTDGEIMCVLRTGGNLVLSSCFAALGWNYTFFPDLTIVASAAPTSAIIAVASDYVANTGATFLVGVNGGVTGLYRISGRINAAGAATATIWANSVISLAISGPMATSTVYASKGDANVYKSTTITAAVASVAWSGKAVSGTNASIAVTGSLVYAGTSGADSAINVSSNAGASYQQVGLMDCGALVGGMLTVALVNITPVDANTMYLIMSNTANMDQYLFKTANAGVSWQRIYVSKATSTPWTIIASGTATSGSGGGNPAALSGSPITLGPGSQIITLVGSNDGYFTVTLPAGVTGTVTNNNNCSITSGGTLSPGTNTVVCNEYSSSPHSMNVTLVGSSGVTITANPLTVATSTAYATDSSVAFIDGTNVVRKSADGGLTFTPYGVATAGLSSLWLTDTNNLFVGATTGGGLYKLGAIALATGLPTSSVSSFALNSKDATKATLMVGCANGAVYESVNNGAAFTQLGTAAVAAGPALVAYGPDGTRYASFITVGTIYRYDAAGWTKILGNYVPAVVGPPAVAAVPGIDDCRGLAVSTDGTLYAADYVAGFSVFRSLNPTAAAPAAPAFSQLNFGGASAGHLLDLAVFSSATANSVYVIDDTTVETTNKYLYAGRILGFSDTLITASAITSPTNGSVVTDVTSTTLKWPAVTGATAYEVTYDNTVVVASQTGLTYSAAGTQGTSHTWSVRVIAPIPNRSSATATFTFALAPPGVTTVQSPNNGATNVPVDTTFTWPASTVSGATYEFVIAEELGNVDKFAIIDYSATCPTNATPLRETLKYDTIYWWRVRTVTGTSKSDWTVSFFTTEKAPPPPTTATTPPPPVTITTTNFTVTNPPGTTITISNPPSTVAPPAIPSYLLWAVIAVGAVLVIAVIVLIVRTRKI